MIHLTPEQKAFLLASNPSPTSKQQSEIVEAVGKCTRYDLFLAEAIRHKTYLTVYNNLKEADVVSALKGYLHELRQVSKIWSLIEHQYMAELERQVLAINDQGIKVMLLKAFHLLTEFPEYRGLRYFGDIDLLVEPDKTKKVAKLLSANGYSFGYHDRRKNRVVHLKHDASAERLHYELTLLVKTCRLDIDYDEISRARLRELTLKYKLPIVVGYRWATMVVQCDIHWNVAEKTDVASIWSRAIKSSHFSECNRVLLMDPTTLLWFVASRTYLEICTSTSPYHLKSVFDVLLHVKRKWREIDVRRLRDMSLEYETLPAVFYYLSHLEKIFRIRGARELLVHLAQGDVIYRRGKDYGDFLPRMFDLVATHRFHVLA